MLSQGLYKGINYLVAVVLLGLIAEIFAKSLDKEDVADSKTTDKHCFCRIEDMYTEKVIYDYDKLESYDLSGDLCHEAHRQCRTACTAKLNLMLYDGVGTRRRGYSFCTSYGDVTPGGAAVVLRAAWKVDNCRTVHEVESIKTVDLCCGYTFKHVDRKYTRVFGWNPDCKNEIYVLGKIKQ